MPRHAVAGMTMMLLALVLAGPARAQGDRPSALPEGSGRAEVEAACTRCHRLTLIPRSAGNTREGWTAWIESMVTLPDPDRDAIVSYLAEHFPVRPAPEAVLIAGGASVTIREWLLPTLGSRPHDPLAASDGSVWWTGQFANRMGRLDPSTGTMREYPLATAGSGPHGLAEDGAGHIWFTAVSGGYVGQLDPTTGIITEYAVPAGARGPHTPVFDQRGTLWFTLQSGMVGRIVPATGEMRVVSTPSEGSYPYGLVVNSQGAPWYVDFRGNRVGSVDPETMEIREHTLPDPDARPRRLALTPDDVLWYTDYARGFLGRFDPATGSVREWPSPGGPESRPYGIAAIGTVVWYSESGVRPNTLVRFDTQTERFQTWAIPSGGGVVRNMMATSGGNLVLACSGVNRVAVVQVDRGAR